MKIKNNRCVWKETGYEGKQEKGEFVCRKKIYPFRMFHFLLYIHFLLLYAPPQEHNDT